MDVYVLLSGPGDYYGPWYESVHGSLAGAQAVVEAKHPISASRIQPFKWRARPAGDRWSMLWSGYDYEIHRETVAP